MDLKLFDRYQLADNLVTKCVEKSHATERGELLTEILNTINQEREGTKFKKTTIRAIAVLLSHIPTKDLYVVISMAKDYKNRNGSYSKYIYGALKVK
jgi:hypothetical protein